AVDHQCADARAAARAVQEQRGIPGARQRDHRPGVPVNHGDLQMKAAALVRRFLAVASFAAALLPQSAGATMVPLDNIAKVVGGGVFTCSLSNAGGVKCWGWNDLASIGD